MEQVCEWKGWERSACCFLHWIHSGRQDFCLASLPEDTAEKQSYEVSFLGLWSDCIDLTETHTHTQHQSIPHPLDRNKILFRQSLVLWTRMSSPSSLALLCWEFHHSGVQPRTHASILERSGWQDSRATKTALKNGTRPSSKGKQGFPSLVEEERLSVTATELHWQWL